MSKVFLEENKLYQLDCSKALWATDAVHEVYRANKIGLKDVDFIIEQIRVGEVMRRSRRRGYRIYYKGT